jgi:methylated-DNA-[protein]-cysteine S-methyltransferase
MLPTPTTSPEDSLIDELRAAFADPLDTTQVRRRHDALVADAERNDLLDVSFRVIDSPVGPLLLAATAAGLVRVAFECEDHDVIVEQLATTISPRVMRGGRRLDGAARQLDEYLAGRRTRFELSIDLQLASGFRRTVLTHLPEIAYGTTASYATLATVSGNPKAVRAAASACSHNPLPLVIPCHRIVKSDGSIGNYLAGTAIKRTLLTMESAHAA